MKKAENKYFMESAARRSRKNSKDKKKVKALKAKLRILAKLLEKRNEEHRRAGFCCFPTPPTERICAAARNEATSV